MQQANRRFYRFVSLVKIIYKTMTLTPTNGDSKYIKIQETRETDGGNLNMYGSVNRKTHTHTTL